MIEKIDLFCPNLKRKVHIEVCIPRHYEDGVEFDTLYMLDGQNIYKDKDASFGRSLHMTKYLAIFGEKYNKRICGVSIYNAGTDLGRTNEYAPFPLEGEAKKIWKKQNVKVYEKFTKDFIYTIIPYIQKKYPVKKNPQNTYLFGSSLGALYTSVVCNKYPSIFGVAGCFSNCSFICEKSFYEYFEKEATNKVRFFNYVGSKEISDGSFDETLYYNYSLKFHKLLLSKGIESRLVVDINGEHNEKTWEKHITQFLSFIYFKDIDITI